MTDEEIDKWVESHIHYPENSDIAPAVIKWAKYIAHKFYELGKQEEYDKR